MAENTNIEWCDSSWNPWIGCTKVGPGCDHCYAEADFDLRKHRAKWGSGNARSRTSPANWKKPIQWNQQPFSECMKCGWRGELRHSPVVKNPDGFYPPADAACVCPSCRHPMLKAARRRVFCASLADVFDNEVPDEWRSDLIRLIEKTPNLDWLILTKRIGNVTRMIEDATDLIDYGEGWQSMWGQGKWPDHVWLGATICNQEEADRDIPKLLAVPAAVRFVSMEPLLGPVDLLRARSKMMQAAGPAAMEASRKHSVWIGVDWVVVGGESGPKARPIHPDWAYSLAEQCNAAGIPLMFKQWGEWVTAGARAFGTADGEVRHIRSDGTFWNEDDPALQDECADVLTVVRVGKKAAGRDLGGKLHDGYPEARA